MSFRLFSKFKSEKVLWCSQIALSVIGSLGIVGVIWFDSKLFEYLQLNAEGISIFFAHIPIVVTGILAGIQIPLLSVLGNSIKKRADMFVEVLGIDYFGSLVGAVSYGLILYPYIGLIKTAFFVGLVNAMLAILCLIFIAEKKNIRLFSFAVIGIFVLLSFNSPKIEKSIMDTYMLVSVYKEKAVDHRNFLSTLAKRGILPGRFANPNFSISIDNYFNTPYQEVIKYTVKTDGIVDDCLKLSRHTNMCDSWANSYHDALANVPISFLPKREKPYEVLLLGGGSLLPIKNLLKYNVNIDQVDIDEKFIDYARTDPYFVKYHQNSWQDPRAHIYFDDAYTFLRNNQKKYDLVVMSLPGFGSDKLIPFGSVEFYTFLNRALTDDGLMVTWEYGNIDDDSKNDFSMDRSGSKHLETLFAGIKGGGFISYLTFNSYLKVDNQADMVPSDIFYLFQKQDVNRTADLQSNEYMQNMQKYYANMQWHLLENLNLNGVRASHIFSPNYDIMTEL
jgi:spermidine synthase